jgi:hypothetical protein
MDLMGLIAHDQEKIFGSVKDFGEAIEYRDEFGNEVTVRAFVQREIVEAKTSAGYSAPVGRQCLYVWISQDSVGGLAKVTKGVDRVKAFWRSRDSAKTEFIVTAILPDSDGVWHLECTR